MQISHQHKFICIGIPRNGSKSMFEWLHTNYQSEYFMGHHAYQIPKEYKDYFVFTLVRNPYERTVSGWFFEPVIKGDDWVAPPNSLKKRMKLAAKAGYTRQIDFVREGGVDMILYFERLTECLKHLPFVDPDHLPPFPHNNLGGFRPAEGNFFDFFNKEEEKLVWENDKEEFDFFGYQRFNCGLPEELPDFRLLSQP